MNWIKNAYEGMRKEKRVCYDYEPGNEDAFSCIHHDGWCCEWSQWEDLLRRNSFRSGGDIGMAKIWNKVWTKLYIYNEKH